MTLDLAIRGLAKKVCWVLGLPKCDELRPLRRAAGDPGHREGLPRLPLQGREGARAGRGALLRRRPHEADRRARLAGHRDLRGGRRAGPRPGRAGVLLEESGFACAPTPAAGHGRRRAGDLRRRDPTSSAPSGCRSSPPARRPGPFGGVSPDGESTLFCDLPTADVAVVFDGEGALLAPASELDFEPVETIDATRSYATVSAPAGERLAGRRRRRPRPARGRDRRRAHRGRPARDGDGRRVRARAPAVRPADRLLPGGLPPLRGDAARRRGVALAHLLRGLGRRRRARVAADGGGDGQRPRRRRRLGDGLPRRFRSSAASASPGSTTSSSGSSAPASPAACWAARASTASASPPSRCAPASRQPSPSRPP